MRTAANGCEPVMKYYNDVRMMSVIRINYILKEFMTSSKRINKTLKDLIHIDVIIYIYIRLRDIYIYIYIHIYIHIYIYIYIYVYIQVYINKYENRSLCIYNSYIYTYVYVYIL